MILSARIVTPEILDTLDAGHPEARRSRRDLRRLEWFLGGSRWIARAALEHRRDAGRGIVELGAGGGELCGKLAASMPECPVTGLDYAGRPSGLNSAVQWRSGDFFQTLPGSGGGLAAGNLILHHLSDEALRLLGAMLAGFRALLFSEPLRASWPLGLSRLAHPFVGKVTRHDMPASIRAGFRPGELAGLLGLEQSSWRVEEVPRITGVLRFKAWRA
jgi:hypothetical protein